jgi:tetratricopeptide (TPR) repeat protein
MNHSKNAFSICLVSVAMGLLLVLPNAIADGPLGHDAAIVALGYPEEKERLAAAERLGDIGTMEDVHYLLGSLRDESENVRNRAEASIWQIWSHSGSSAIDQMFERGVREMTERNFSRAISTFSEIIRAKPDFAEAWNKRATLYFGALAGYGQIYIELDQLEKALEYFQRALNVNPNLVVVANTMHKLERILHKRKDNIV